MAVVVVVVDFDFGFGFGMEVVVVVVVVVDLDIVGLRIDLSIVGFGTVVGLNIEEDLNMVDLKIVGLKKVGLNLNIVVAVVLAFVDWGLHSCPYLKNSHSSLKRGSQNVTK